MKRIFSTILLITLFISQFYGQNGNLPEVFNQRVEAFFKFSVDNLSELQQLTNIISIDKVDGNEVYAYANAQSFLQFLNFGYNYTILTPPSLLHPPVMKSDINIKSINAWDYYPTYGAYESMMYQFESTFPALCKIYTIGNLNSGRKILAAKISSNVNQNGNKPRFNYSSSMHGDELTGYVLMLRFIDYLLSNYGTNQRVTYLVNNIEIWITPLENPDGAYTNNNSTVSGATRGNANGVDLNRNYKNPVTGNHPDGNAWQQETVFTMAFTDTMNFTMSANLHGGIECVNYPWDSWLSSVKTHADHIWWQYVSHEYADTARFYSPSSYMSPSGPSFFNGVTHGGDWYVVRGSRQDYLGYYTHTRELTLEISNTKLPSASQLPTFWDYNYRSFLNYMQQCLYGIRGLVTDSCTNAPIKAQISIVGHDIDNSQVYSFMPLGNYHRPIMAGVYNVTFSAPGYQSKTIQNVSVTNYNTTVLDVKLKPLLPQATVNASTTNSCDGQVAFTSLIDNATSWLWNFGDGNTSTVPNPVHIYTSNGQYNVNLVLTNCAGTQTVYLSTPITVNMPLPPTANNVYLCQSGSTTLSAVANAGTIEWFDSISSQVPLATGSTFTTPVISQTTTYYVGVKTATNLQVGEANSNSNGSMFTSSNYHYLIFDCSQNIRIVSVEVNASTAGNRTIYLRNGASQTIDSVTVFIPMGVSRIPLNLNVPAGSNWQLMGPLTPNLFRSNAGLSYPYNASPYVSITSSSAGTSYYYYFYDWEVVTNECSSVRTPVTVFMHSVPQADFSYLVNNLSVQFTNTSLDGISYTWDFGDGQTSILDNPTHQFANYGTYTVALTTTNNCGNHTQTKQIVLSTLPPVAEFSANQTNVNEGTYVQFSDLSQNNPNTWQWHFEGGTPTTSNLPNPTILYPSHGTYFVTLTVSNPFGNDNITKTAYITVNEVALPPVVDFSAHPLIVYIGDTVYFTDLTIYNPSTWSWQFENGYPMTAATQHPKVVYNIPGLYYVTLTATNAYGNGTLTKTAYIRVDPTSVFEYTDKSSLSMTAFPNPATNKLNLVFNKDMNSPLNFYLSDMLGKRIALKPLKIDERTFEINLSNIKDGLYFITVMNAECYITQKILLQNKL